MIPKYYQYATFKWSFLLRAQGLLTHSAFETATKLLWANLIIW